MWSFVSNKKLTTMLISNTLFLPYKENLSYHIDTPYIPCLPLTLTAIPNLVREGSRNITTPPLLQKATTAREDRQRPGCSAAHGVPPIVPNLPQNVDITCFLQTIHYFSISDHLACNLTLTLKPLCAQCPEISQMGPAAS